MDNVWTNPNNWSTVGFFSGVNGGTFPGPADVATFGLLGETTAPITFTGIPLAGVGAINAVTLQRVITIPAGETLTIAGTGSDAGGNAVINIAPGATMRILAGATVQGAGGAHRWQINGTLELVDNGAVVSSGMGFAPGSTLLYSGTGAKTVGFEFTDGNTNLPYATGFPGNITVNNSAGVTLGANTLLNANLAISSGSLSTGGFSLTLGNVTNSIAAGASLIVNNGGLLNTVGFLVSGAGAFTLQAGGTLQTANTNGINGGAIQVTGTRTFDNGANYILNHTGALDQAIGLGTIAQMNNLTLTNAVPNRAWMQDAPSLSINGTLTLNGRYVMGCTGTHTLVINNGTGTRELWVGGQAGNVLTINGTFTFSMPGSLTLSNAGCPPFAPPTINGAGNFQYNAGATLNIINNTLTTQSITNKVLPSPMAGDVSIGGGTTNVAVSSQINGNLTINTGIVNTGAFTLTLNGATNNNIGTLNISNNGRVVILATRTLSNTGTIDVQTGGTLEIQDDGAITGASPTYSATGARGTLTYTGAGFKGVGLEWAAMMDGNVIINKGAPNQMALASAPTRTQNGTLTVSTGLFRISGSGNLALAAAVPVHTVQNAAELRIGDGATVTGLGNVTVNAGGTLSVYYNGGTVPVRTGSPNFLANGILYYGGTSVTLTGTEFPNTMPGAVTILNTAGIVQEAGTTKTVTGTFTVLGTGIYSLNGGTGNGLVLDGPLLFTGAGFLQSLNNNFTINNTVTGTLRFGPTAGEQTLNNFTMGAASGNTPLGAPLVIGAAGSLNLNGGNIGTTAINSLTITNTAAGAVTRTAGFVNGPLIRVMTGAGAYQFPLGNGGQYLPLTLTNPGAVTVAASAFNANPNGSGGVGLTSPSTTEYWLTNVTAGAWGAGASVTLQRAANFAASTVVGRRDAGTSNGPYNSAGPASFPGGTNVITSNILTAPAAPMFFTTGIGAQPATNLTFGAITNISFTANFSAAVPVPTGYLVVRRLASAAPTSPTNGIPVPTVGAALGLGTVVSNNGSLGPIANTGLVAGTTYAIDVYSYYGTVATPTYMTAQVLTGNVTTTGGAGCTTVAPPATVNVNLFERSIDFTGVSLTGGGVLLGSGTNQVYATPGGALTLAYNFAGVGAMPTYCPGCITQIYVGLNSAPATNVFRDCLNNFAFNATGSRTGINFTAPATPGVYYINVTGTWDFSCQPVNFGTSYVAGNTIGMVIVGTPPCIDFSDIVPLGFVPNTAIPYISQPGPVVVPAMTNVWNFRLRDGGTTTPTPQTDGDNYPTVLQQMTMTISNPAPLNRIALYNGAGTVKLDEQIAGATVTFTIPAGLRAANSTAADDGFIDFLLKASYQTTVIDNAQFNFTITSAVCEPFAPATPRSGLLNPLASIGPSGNSGVAVIADRLNVLTQPIPTIVTGATMRASPVVQAIDANGSIDVDYVGTVTAGNPKLTPATPSTTTAVLGVATFPNIMLLGSSSATETLSFDDIGPFPAVNSNMFELLHPRVSFTPSTFFNIGAVALGTIKDTVITVNGQNVIANGSAYFARTAPGMTFSFPAMPLQITPLTLTPSVTPSDMQGVPYSQVIRIRYQPLSTNRDTAIIRATFGQSNVPIIVIGRGVNPDPYTLSYTRRQLIYDSSGVANRAVQSGSVIDSIFVSTFRQDSVWIPITGTRTITLTPLPVAGSTGTFTINNMVSISVPITNTTVATFSNVTVRWTNAPITASNTPVLLKATINDPSVLSTTISLTLNVGNTQPRITSFSPRFAAPGQQITITGTDFFSIQSVRLNGRAATFTTPSSTQIIATVPTGILADTGMVFVSNGIFADSLSKFEVARPPQIREYFATSSGARRGYDENVQAENKPLRIIGRNLRPRFNTSEAYAGTSVSLGNVPTSFVNVLNDSTADAIVGAGASGTLQYQNPAGTTTSSVRFEFLPPPEISGITPLFGGLNTEITVTGANFRVLDTLRLGSVVIPNNRLTIDNGFTRLRFRLADTVVGAIRLTTAAGSTTSSQQFTFVPPPEILMVTPDTGTFGTSITLTGRNFIQVTTVTVGSRPPLIVSRISSTQLIVVAGSGLTGQAPITLATPGGSTSSSIQFTFINVPQVLNFSPPRGGPGTEVIITGANFTNIQQVTFGELPAKSFTVRSTSEIVAIVDDNGATGQVKVLNSAGQGTGRSQFQFYFPPIVGLLSPFSGATGSTVVISGQNFVEVSTVTIGGIPVAEFVVETPERIVAIVSTGATGRVVITNPGGTGQSSSVFRFIEPERPPAPFISNFSPDTAFVGDVVKLEGFNFINVRNVKINGVTVSTYSVDSPTAITLVVPVTSTGTIEVTSTTGTGIAKKIFVYAPPPKPLTPREQDSISAVRLYNSTDGQNWARQLGWLTTTPLEQWQGVTVEGGRITRLVLDSAGLRGEVPAFISRLTALKYISLRVNELQGAFPQGLTLLQNLEEVLLSNNQFTGTLPTGFGKMLRLKILRLDGNRFTGGIPADVCELPNLQELSLAQNRLTGRISACISRITTLQRLDLSQNQFTGGIPSEFADLVNLRELVVNNNTLAEPLPTGIWGSASNLASNLALTGKTSSQTQAGGMAALTLLDLSNNRITGAIPTELGNASRVETILLNGNQFTGEIPRAFGNLKALRTLDLSQNRLTGQVPNGLTDARALERLALSNNKLAGRIPAELSNLPNLRAIALDSNEFVGAVPEAFTQLARLQSLRLNANKLTSLPNLRGLTALTVLNVASNQLMFETIDPNVRTGDVAFTYTFAPQDTVRLLRDTAAAVGFRFIVSLPIVNENNTYQWFKNGRPVPNTNNTSLSFAAFTRLDTGLYFCQITNRVARGLTLTTQPIRISAAQVTVPDAAPLLVFPANGVGNIELTATFTWEVVRGASVYEIQIATDSAFTDLVANETTNSLQFRPANNTLKNFTTYRWRVRARNEAGAGVWSVVRSFTTLQEGAIVVIPDTDLGRSVVGRQRVGTVRVQNLLTIPVSIESARIGGRDVSSFGIRTSLAGAMLMPGEALPVEIVFTPQSIGAKQAELLINVSSGGAANQQRGILRGTASLLDVNDVQFDTVLAGFSKIRNAAVLNLGNAAVRINALRIPPADTSIFKIDLPTLAPYTIAKGDTLILPISCSTSRLGKAKTTITVVTDAGDSLAVNAEAEVREVRPSDIRATFGLRALDSNVAPGGRVRVKLFIYDNKPEHGRDVFRVDNLAQYRAEIRFNRNVLVVAPDEKRMVAVGNDEFQRYSIPQTTWSIPSSDANEIGVFNCVAVSGNVEKTPLLISDLKWGNNDKLFISYAVTTGTFTANLCKAGGLRLTTTAQKNAIAQIRPNPAKDEANIVYSVREDGAIELSLFDVQGRLVQALVHGEHTPGEYSLSVPTTQLPSGSYFLVMLTPSGKVQERLQVVR
jgi:Leucine-rich repeat (LRR) protein